MLLQTSSGKLAIKIFGLLSLLLGVLVIAAPYVLAQVDTSQQQQVVSDFATFIINILTGPVSILMMKVAKSLTTCCCCDVSTWAKT